MYYYATCLAEDYQEDARDRVFPTKLRRVLFVKTHQRGQWTQAVHGIFLILVDLIHIKHFSLEITRCLEAMITRVV